ncbi:hypothetical protein RHMOL_Rhmol07G0179500 [Rhododendron molle]|uniref:Uncharacterized protein n=1 Tax=Rhododendron molle TaxID=49168 RepID=A0ACC0N3V4_RHOML|nr:hypothetical protein RHMOL_Rhmol07G0179500 [Rhododendron molle]
MIFLSVHFCWLLYYAASGYCGLKVVFSGVLLVSSSAPFVVVDFCVFRRRALCSVKEGSFRTCETSRTLNVDLVEVQRKAKPPVCKLADYHKEKYKQQIKEKDGAKSKIIDAPFAQYLMGYRRNEFIHPHVIVRFRFCLKFSLCEKMMENALLDGESRGRGGGHRSSNGWRDESAHFLRRSPYQKAAALVDLEMIDMRFHRNSLRFTKPSHQRCGLFKEEGIGVQQEYLVLKQACNKNRALFSLIAPVEAKLQRLLFKEGFTRNSMKALVVCGLMVLEGETGRTYEWINRSPVHWTSFLFTKKEEESCPILTYVQSQKRWRKLFSVEKAAAEATGVEAVTGGEMSRCTSFEDHLIKRRLHLLIWFV